MEVLLFSWRSSSFGVSLFSVMPFGRSCPTQGVTSESHLAMRPTRGVLLRRTRPISGPKARKLESSLSLYIYIYIDICIVTSVAVSEITSSLYGVKNLSSHFRGDIFPNNLFVGRGDATVGNPPRARISRFELFDLIILFLLLRLDASIRRGIRAASISINSILPPLYIYIYIHTYIHTYTHTYGFPSGIIR